MLINANVEIMPKCFYYYSTLIFFYFNSILRVSKTYQNFNNKYLLSLFLTIIIFINLVNSCGLPNYGSNWTNKQKNSFDNKIGQGGHRVKRIVGGNNSFGWKYSWYGVLISVTKNEVHCGATLISANHLLTAAHCFDHAYSIGKKLHEYYNLHMGVYNICSKYSRRQEIFKLKKVLIHDHYYQDIGIVSGDIAILYLNEDVHQYEPICLPITWNNIHIGSMADVIGFGVTQSKWRENSCVLKETSIKIYSFEECLNSANDNSFNFLDTFCAGVMEGGNDACQGDSGGPLQMKHYDGSYSIIGIVSFGVDCALRRHPGVYTNVTFYHKWILNNIYD